jgi:hypothetical protein
MIIKGGSLLLGHRSDRLEKRSRRIAQCGLAAVNEPQDTLDLQFFDHNLHQVAGFQLMSDGQVRDESDAVPHGDEPLNGLDRRQFDGHVQGRAVPLERFNDFSAQWRRDMVGNEILASEIVDGNSFGTRQGVVGAHDKGKAIAIDGDGTELGRIRTERDHADLEGAKIQLLGNAAG